MFGFKSKKIKGHEQAFDDWHTKSMDYPEEAVDLLFENHYSYQFYFCGGIYLLGRDLESEFKTEEKLAEWKYKQIEPVSISLTEAERTKLKLSKIFDFVTKNYQIRNFRNLSKLITKITKIKKF